LGFWITPATSYAGVAGNDGVTTSTGAGLYTGVLPQAANIPTMATTQTLARSRLMALLLLEALGAGTIFIGIIWWTMFSGRKNGELVQPPTPQKPEEKAASAPHEKTSE
jgi:hypothetical protein